MANPKPLTKKDLLAALKDLPTKKDVRSIVSDEVHEQMSEFHAKMTMPALKDLENRLQFRFTKVDKRFASIDKRLAKLEVGQAHIGDQINGLKADLSDTPSRREFEQLKARVDKYHPAHD